jgi:hypothetical protein
LGVGVGSLTFVSHYNIADRTFFAIALDEAKRPGAFQGENQLKLRGIPETSTPRRDDVIAGTTAKKNL